MLASPGKMSSICIAAKTNSLLKQYADELASRGIATCFVKRNQEEDRRVPGVRLVTMHRVKGPSDPAITELIESMFNEEGIQVVWHNESVEESKARNISEDTDDPSEQSIAEETDYSDDCEECKIPYESAEETPDRFPVCTYESIIESIW